MFRFLFTLIYSMLLLSLSGITNLALATVSCNDPIYAGTTIKYVQALDHFIFYNGSTYAIAKSANTGIATSPDGYFAMSANIDAQYSYTGVDNGSLRKLLATGVYGAAVPVIIADAATQAFIITNYGQYLGAASTSQSTYVNAWKDYGAGAPFTQISGGALTFSNWSSGSAGTAPNVAQITVPQDVTMGSDGGWVNGQDGQCLAQIVEFPGMQLDCAVDATTTEPPVTPGPTPTLPPLMCMQDLNGDGIIEANEQAACVTTAQGVFCPVGDLPCNVVTGTPICPVGTTLNSTDNMCEVAPVITCPPGSSATNLTCQAPMTKGCPAGYTLTSDGTQCESRPVCTQGYYNDVSKRCEVPAQTTTSYTNATQGVLTETKYEARGHYATSSSDYTTAPSSLDVMQYLFTVSNGQVVLNTSVTGEPLGECNWGGDGNCGCASPNWDYFCWNGVDITQTYIGTTLSVYAHVWYYNTQDPQCLNPGYPYLYNSNVSGIGLPSYACYQYYNSYLGGYGASIAVTYPKAYDYYSNSGSVCMADLSEFLSCPPGYTLSPPLTQAQCQAVITEWGNATGVTQCTSPTYNCEGTTTACPVGETMSTTGGCAITGVNPYCPTGNGTVTFNQSGTTQGSNMCYTPYIINCPTGTNYNPADGLCETGATVTCPTGTGYTALPVGECQAIPVCSGSGTFDPIQHTCIMSTNCPYGSQYTCMEYNGSYQCSTNQCFNPANPPGGQTIDNGSTSWLTNDAQNPDGSCAGQILIFNGAPSRCRPPGLTVGEMNNCCASSQVMAESVGDTYDAYAAYQTIETMYQMAEVGYYTYEVAQGAMTVAQAGTALAGASSAVMTGVGTGVNAALDGASTAASVGSAETAYLGALLNPATIVIAVVIMIVMKVLMGGGCDQRDIQCGEQVASKDCHYIGQYCEKHWFFGCVQEANGYCCFNSMMARIIQEQGRPQLSTFGPTGDWGPPDNPNCRGFTPEEFEAIDFAKIDFSEYISVIQNNIATEIQNAQGTIQTNIQNSYNQNKK
jgi:conjugal transfer mating pair stabilization protein TraN